MPSFPIIRHDGEALSPEVRAFDQSSSLTDNTRTAYWGDIRRFLEWGGKIPAPSKIVASYLAAHAQSHKISTLIRWKVSIGKAHTTQGLPDPTDTEMVRMMLKGIQSKQGDVPPRQVLPLLARQLVEIVGGMGTRLKDRRDRALLLIGFAGALRRSELKGLQVSDLLFVPEGLILRTMEGFAVGIPSATTGEICPVAAVKDLLAVSGIVEGSLFQGINRHGHLNQVSLSTHGIALIVKERVQAIGLDANLYSSHSLRSGFIISTMALGKPDWLIRQHVDRKGEIRFASGMDTKTLFLNHPGDVFAL
ncbi:MAG: hypothetical protein H7832_01280 [Magnetococcus sp. DMHC-6]